MILLINPEPPKTSPWGLSKMLPPLGLAYIAGMLEKHGFKVQIFDNYLYEKPLKYIQRMVEKLNPEIVGIGCNSLNYRKCVETAKAVKEANPNCRVVVGGPHPSYMPETMLQHKQIDYVVVGEGERAMVELATLLLRGESEKVKDIPGIAFKQNGKIVRNEPVLIDNLDEIPFPARHLLPMNQYDRTINFLSVKPVDTMNVVRGCPYNCKFCETKRLWGSRCRYFSPLRVVKEIEHLKDNFGSKGVYFIGDNFTINSSKTIEICRLIRERGIDIEWTCDTRVDLVSREILVEMKKAGCRTIWFGVESGSPRILKEINKGITLEQILHAFKLCKEIGISTACSFLLGVPGETYKDMEMSFKLANKLDPDWCQFNIFIAVPGSKFYDEILEKKLYSHIEDFIAYVKTEEFDYKHLIEIQRKFHLNFYRSPKRIVKRILKRSFSFLKIQFFTRRRKGF